MSEYFTEYNSSIFVICGTFGKLFARQHLSDRIRDAVDAAGTEDSVDLGTFFHDLLAVSLCEAPGHDYPFEIPVFLQPGDVENVVDRLFFCALDESAGVYYHYLFLFHLYNPFCYCMY